MSTIQGPVRSRHWPKTFPDVLPIPETSLWANLETTARRYPDKAAYIFFGKPLSFGALQAAATRLANWLVAHGIEPGDRCCLYMQNSPAFPIVFYALMRLGAVAVPVNPMCKEDELAYFAGDSGSRLIFCADDLAPTAERVRRQRAEAGQVLDIVSFGYGKFMSAPGTLDDDERPTAEVEAWLRSPGRPAFAHHRLIDILAQPCPLTTPAATPDDTALIAYTSGTTGFPKGCVHTHRGLMANAVIGYWNNMTAGAVSLASVPMFHITGLLYYVLSNVYIGHTSVLINRWDKALAARLIHKYRVSHWTCIPTMIVDILGDDAYKRFGFDVLKYVSGGGTGMPKAIAQRLKDEFGLGFVEGYGLTETVATTLVNLPSHPLQQCLGVPTIGTTALVIDPETRQALPAHGIGEIVLAGPTVFQGYWNKADETRQSFIKLDGKTFFKTGDIGYYDEDGHFYLTDRSKRMINSSGFKVWPSEVEALFYLNEHIREVCVVGVQDDYRGECAKAFVVLKAESAARVDADELKAWARAHMAAYKIPKFIEFRDALPKSGSGKIMWKALQDAENPTGA